MSGSACLYVFIILNLYLPIHYRAVHIGACDVPAPPHTPMRGTSTCTYLSI